MAVSPVNANDVKFQFHNLENLRYKKIIVIL